MNELTEGFLAIGMSLLTAFVVTITILGVGKVFKKLWCKIKTTKAWFRIVKLFERDISRGVTYHMQDHQCWGDSIQWSEWPKLKVHGHLYKRPVKGDILTCDFETGTRLEFQFVYVEHCSDPRDMFFANVKFLGEVSDG